MKLSDKSTNLLINKRKQLNITQSELAELISVNKGTYSRYESGNFDFITMANMSIICRKLHIPMMQLEYENGVPVLDPETNHEFSFLSDIFLQNGYVVSLDDNGKYKVTNYENDNVRYFTQSEMDKLNLSISQYCEFIINQFMQ